MAFAARAAAYAASALAVAVVCMDITELSADVLSVLLSILVTPFAFTVTEHERSDPLVDMGRFQVAEEAEVVIASDDCVMPLIDKL